MRRRLKEIGHKTLVYGLISSHLLWVEQAMAFPQTLVLQRKEEEAPFRFYTSKYEKFWQELTRQTLSLKANNDGKFSVNFEALPPSSQIDFCAPQGDVIARAVSYNSALYFESGSESFVIDGPLNVKQLFLKSKGDVIFKRDIDTQTSELSAHNLIFEGKLSALESLILSTHHLSTQGKLLSSHLEIISKEKALFGGDIEADKLRIRCEQDLELGSLERPIHIQAYEHILLKSQNLNHFADMASAGEICIKSSLLYNAPGSSINSQDNLRFVTDEFYNTGEIEGLTLNLKADLTRNYSSIKIHDTLKTQGKDLKNFGTFEVGGNFQFSLKGNFINDTKGVINTQRAQGTFGQIHNKGALTIQDSFHSEGTNFRNDSRARFKVGHFWKHDSKDLFLNGFVDTGFLALLQTDSTQFLGALQGHGIQVSAHSLIDVSPNSTFNLSHHLLMHSDIIDWSGDVLRRSSLEPKINLPQELLKVLTEQPKGVFLSGKKYIRQAGEMICEHGTISLDSKGKISHLGKTQTRLGSFDQILFKSGWDLSLEKSSHIQGAIVDLKAKTILARGKIEASQSLKTKSKIFNNQGEVSYKNGHFKADRLFLNTGSLKGQDTTIDALASINAFGGSLSSQNLKLNTLLDLNFLGKRAAFNTSINSLASLNLGVDLPRIESFSDFMTVENFKKTGLSLVRTFAPKGLNSLFNLGSSLQRVPALYRQGKHLWSLAKSLDQDWGMSDVVPLLCGAKDLAFSINQSVQDLGPLLKEGHKLYQKGDLKQTVVRQAEGLLGCLLVEAELPSFSWKDHGSTLKTIASTMGPHYNNDSLVHVNAGLNLGINGHERNLLSLNTGGDGFLNSHTLETDSGRNFGLLVAPTLSVSAQKNYEQGGFLKANQANLQSQGTLFNSGVTDAKTATLHGRLGLSNTNLVEGQNLLLSSQGNVENFATIKGEQTLIQGQTIKTHEGSTIEGGGFQAEGQDIEHNGVLDVEKSALLKAENTLKTGEKSLFKGQETQAYSKEMTLSGHTNAGDATFYAPKMTLQETQSTDAQNKTFATKEDLDIKGKFQGDKFTVVSQEGKVTNYADLKEKETIYVQSKKEFENVGQNIESKKIEFDVAKLVNLSKGSAQYQKVYGPSLNTPRDQEGGNIKGEYVHANVREGNLENHGGAIEASLQLGANVKGDILGRYNVYEKGDKKDFKPAIFKGGTGIEQEIVVDGRTIKIQNALDLNAQGKIINEASFFTSQGDSLLFGKEGIENTIASHTRVIGSYEKSSWLGFKKEKGDIAEITFLQPHITAPQGRNFLFSDKKITGHGLIANSKYAGKMIAKGDAQFQNLDIGTGTTSYFWGLWTPKQKKTIAESQIRSDQGDLSVQAQNLKIEGQMTGQNIFLLAESLKNKAKVVAKDTLQAVIDGTIDNEGQMTGQNISLRAQNLENKGEVAAKDTLQAVIDETIDNERSGKLSGGKVVDLKSKWLHNKGDIHSDEATNLDIDYGIFNTGGSISGKDTSINTAAFVNFLGGVKGQSSLRVNSLLSANLLGTMRSSNLSVNSLISLNAGLYLPTIPDRLSDLFTFSNGLTLLRNFAPPVGGVVGGGIAAYKGGMAVYNFAQNGRKIYNKFEKGLKSWRNPGAIAQLIGAGVETKELLVSAYHSLPEGVKEGITEGIGKGFNEFKEKEIKFFKEKGQEVCSEFKNLKEGVRNLGNLPYSLFEVKEDVQGNRLKWIPDIQKNMSSAVRSNDSKSSPYSPVNNEHPIYRKDQELKSLKDPGFKDQSISLKVDSAPHFHNSLFKVQQGLHEVKPGLQESKPRLMPDKKESLSLQALSRIVEPNNKETSFVNLLVSSGVDDAKELYNSTSSYLSNSFSEVKKGIQEKVPELYSNFEKEIINFKDALGNSFSEVEDTQKKGREFFKEKGSQYLETCLSTLGESRLFQGVASIAGGHSSENSLLSLNAGGKFGVNGSERSLYKNINWGAQVFLNSYTLQTSEGSNSGLLLAPQISVDAQETYQQNGTALSHHSAFNGKTVELNDTTRSSGALSVKAEHFLVGKDGHASSKKVHVDAQKSDILGDLKSKEQNILESQHTNIEGHLHSDGANVIQKRNATEESSLDVRVNGKMTGKDQMVEVDKVNLEKDSTFKSANTTAMHTKSLIQKGEMDIGKQAFIDTQTAEWSPDLLSGQKLTLALKQHQEGARGALQEVNRFTKVGEVSLEMAHETFENREELKLQHPHLYAHFKSAANYEPLQSQGKFILYGKEFFKNHALMEAQNGLGTITDGEHLNKSILSGGRQENVVYGRTVMGDKASYKGQHVVQTAEENMIFKETQWNSLENIQLQAGNDITFDSKKTTEQGPYGTYEGYVGCEANARQHFLVKAGGKVSGDVLGVKAGGIAVIKGKEGVSLRGHLSVYKEKEWNNWGLFKGNQGWAEDVKAYLSTIKAKKIIIESGEGKVEGLGLRLSADEKIVADGKSGLDLKALRAQVQSFEKKKTCLGFRRVETQTSETKVASCESKANKTILSSKEGAIEGDSLRLLTKELDIYHKKGIYLDGVPIEKTHNQQESGLYLNVLGYPIIGSSQKEQNFWQPFSGGYENTQTHSHSQGFQNGLIGASEIRIHTTGENPQIHIKGHDITGVVWDNQGNPHAQGAVKYFQNDANLTLSGTDSATTVDRQSYGIGMGADWSRGPSLQMEFSKESSKRESQTPINVNIGTFFNQQEGAQVTFSKGVNAQIEKVEGGKMALTVEHTQDQYSLERLDLGLNVSPNGFQTRTIHQKEHGSINNTLSHVALKEDHRLVERQDVRFEEKHDVDDQFRLGLDLKNPLSFALNTEMNGHPLKLSTDVFNQWSGNGLQKVTALCEMGSNASSLMGLSTGEKEQTQKASRIFQHVGTTAKKLNDLYDLVTKLLPKPIEDEKKPEPLAETLVLEKEESKLEEAQQPVLVLEAEQEMPIQTQATTKEIPQQEVPLLKKNSLKKNLPTPTAPIQKKEILEKQSIKTQTISDKSPPLPLSQESKKKERIYDKQIPAFLETDIYPVTAIDGKFYALSFERNPGFEHEIKAKIVYPEGGVPSEKTLFGSPITREEFEKRYADYEKRKEQADQMGFGIFSQFLGRILGLIPIKEVQEMGSKLKETGQEMVQEGVGERGATYLNNALNLLTLPLTGNLEETIDSGLALVEQSCKDSNRPELEGYAQKARKMNKGLFILKNTAEQIHGIMDKGSRILKEPVEKLSQKIEGSLPPLDLTSDESLLVKNSSSSFLLGYNPQFSETQKIKKIKENQQLEETQEQKEKRELKEAQKFEKRTQELDTALSRGNEILDEMEEFSKDPFSPKNLLKITQRRLQEEIEPFLKGIKDKIGKANP